MKKIQVLLIAIAFILLCINVFGEAKTYPFQVKISGRGKHFIMFDDTDWYNQQLAPFMK